MDEKLNTELGTLLRDARIQAGLSLRQVAAEAELSKSIIENWESGTREPKLDKLLRLAAVLGLDATTVCEVAGYDIDLPAIHPYLRRKYPDLPPQARAEIAAITRKYGADPRRAEPAPGEDEQ